MSTAPGDEQGPETAIGTSVAASSSVDVMCLSLQDQLAGFESILHTHAENMSAIRHHLLSTSAIELGSESSALLSTSRFAPDVSPTNALGGLRDPIELSRLDVHTRNLLTFLDVHSQNVNSLRHSLHPDNDDAPSFIYAHIDARGGPKNHDTQTYSPHASTAPDTYAPQSQPPAPVVTRDKEIEALSQQFSVIVIFSTFATGVVIGYLQLMHDLLPAPDMGRDPKEAIHWELGFGFGFASLVWNLSIAIVAGADTAACASGRAWKSLEEIHSRFVMFVLAQFLGAVLFGGCIGMLLYPVHSGHVLAMLPLVIFPSAFLVAGLDLASTSKEFRALKSDISASLSTFCTLGYISRPRRRRRFEY